MILNTLMPMMTQLRLQRLRWLDLRFQTKLLLLRIYFLPIKSQHLYVERGINQSIMVPFIKVNTNSITKFII